MNSNNYKNKIIIDIGDVLISTYPNKQYSFLSKISGINKDYIKNILEEKLVNDFETGLINEIEFKNEINKILNKEISLFQYRNIWNKVLGKLNYRLIKIILKYFSYDQIILASNTNITHWNYINKKYPILSTFNYILSFNIGFRKPNPEFYKLINSRIKDNKKLVFFIDDSRLNLDTCKDFNYIPILYQNNNSINQYFKNDKRIN